MKRWLTVALILLVDSQAYSKQRTDNSQEKKAKINISQENREGKQFEVLLQPVGLNETVGLAHGILAGFYLNQQQQINLSYSEGNFSFLGYKTNSKVTLASFRHFWLNSLNSTLGFGLRDVTKTGRAFYFSTNEKELDTHKAESVVVATSIGNKWHWEDFTLGCDWATVLIPVTTKTSATYIGEKEPEHANEDKEELDDLAKDYSFQFVKLYVGIAF